MDFGTRSTTTVDDIVSYQPDGNTSLPPKLESERPRPSANTVGATQVLERETKSATTLFPDALLAHWNEIVSTGISVRLYRDLVRLGLGRRVQGNVAMREDSLKSFLQFWARVREGAAEPEIALAPDGTIHAEWYESPKKRLDVRFATPKAFFGLFDGNNILEGVERPEIVAQLLMAYPGRPLSRSSR